MDPNLYFHAATGEQELRNYLENQKQQEQQRQEQPNLVDALGKLALGAGAVAAGAYGLRRLLPAAAKEVAEAPAQMSAVQRAAGAVHPEVARQQRGIELTRLARAERPRGVIQANLSQLQEQVAAANRVLEDPEMIALVKQQQQQERSEALSFQSKAQAEYRNLLSQKADEVIAAVRKEQNTTQAAAQGDFARQYLQERNYVEPSMVVQQQAENPEHVEHAVNALNAAQDQEAARAAQVAVRDVLGADAGRVNARADQLESQYEALAQRTGANPPVDAAMTQAVEEAVGEPVIDQAERLPGPVSAQEMVDMAKQEMMARRQALAESGLQPGTVRFERALAQPFRTAATTQVRSTGPVETALPAGPIRQIVEAAGASEALPERTVLNVGPQAVVTKTAAGTAIRGASPSYHEALPKQEARLLYGTAEPLVPGAPEELGQDIPGALRVRGTALNVEPSQLSKQEIVYSSLDRPAHPEIPGGSAGIGVYGVEPGYVPGAVSKLTGEYSAAAERRPTEPTFKERKTAFEGLTSSQLATGAEQAKSPAIRSAFEAEAARRATTKQSLEASEMLRRARIEGRDPQAILRQLGIGR